MKIKDIIKKYIGNFVASVNGSIIAIVIVVIIILYLNPNQIKSDNWRVVSLIMGIGILLMGTTGASKYRRSDKLAGSLISIMIGTILILFGLGFLLIKS